MTSGTVSFQNRSPTDCPSRATGGAMRSTISVMATASTASENVSTRRVSNLPSRVSKSRDMGQAWQRGHQ